MNALRFAPPQIKPVVGSLHLAGGMRRDTAPCTAMLTPSPQAARERQGEHLFFLLHLTGPAPARLYRELREAIDRSYWSSHGSITAALRKAATAVNHRLFAFNLQAASSKRCYGGLACAVLHSEDLFILISGPARVCVLQKGHLESFPRGGELPHLGMGRLPEVRLYHAFAAIGDTLLLSSPELVSTVDRAGLDRVLPRADVREVIAGLEQVGAGTDFVALVGRLNLQSEGSQVAAPRTVAPPAKPVPRSTPRPSWRQRLADQLQRLRPAGRTGSRAIPHAEPPIEQTAADRLQRADSVEPAEPLPRAEPPVKRPVEPLPRTASPAEKAEPLPRTKPPVEPLQRAAPSAEPAEPLPRAEPPVERPPEPRDRPVITRKPRQRSKPLRIDPRLVERVKNGARTAWHGIAAAGVGIAQGAKTLFRRMLPGPDRDARRQAGTRRRVRLRREPPEENPIVMMAIAGGILALVVILVMLALGTFGADEQFNSLLDQIQKEAAMAQAAGDPAEARARWENVLEQAERAAALRPEDRGVLNLQSQARAALDELDGVIRVTPTALDDFGPAHEDILRRLAIYGQSVYVLAPAEMGWVAESSVNPESASGALAPFVQTGEEVSGGTVGTMVDFAWVEAEGERMTSGLVILEEDGVLVTYDPAWGSESGAPQVTRTYLGTPPQGAPQVVDSFEGRLYILDVTTPQIWRYEPRGNAYPHQPERYFTNPSIASLQDAVDMDIDGNIYVLYTDGSLAKFLRGEPLPFEVRDVPDGFDQPVALTVDAESRSGVIYVADRGHQRVVVLDPDGAFRAQLCAEGAFDALEALAVDEAAGRLYVFSGGTLYVASLPAWSSEPP